MRATLCFIILASAVVSCKQATTGPTPPSGLDTTSHSILWTTDSMGYFSSRLLDLWGTSPSNIYAVGLLQTVGVVLPSFIVHYDGANWAAIQDDSLSRWVGAGLLASIHGISDTAMFVAGSMDSHTKAIGFVARWNGRQWTNISPPDSIALTAIWVKSVTDVYVGGEKGTILRYNGHSWQSLETGTILDIWQITGLPSGEVYAVASDYFNSFAGSLILRIQENNVSQDQFFPVGRKFGIWGTANGEAYAAGEGIFHKSTGSSWQEIATTNPGVAMWSVGGTAADNVLVVGAYGAVSHWNGKSWMFYDELYDRSSSRSYFNAFAIANKYFLVGNTPSHAVITVGTRSEP